MSQKNKISWQLSRLQAAELLRRLADTLEKDSGDLRRFGIDLTELAKFKIKVGLADDDVLDVQFSGKGVSISDAGEGSGRVRESYAELKKRMQSAFSALRASAARGEMPDRRTVAAFVDDAERMTTFTGYGDEFYPDFAELCRRLRAADEAGDRPAAAAVLEELAQARKACHARAK